MSDYERYKGTITSLSGRLPAENVAKNICIKNDWKPYYEDNSWMETLKDYGYGKFLVHKDSIYKIEAEELDSCDDVYEIDTTGDGRYKFFVQYYNGCTGLNEAIGDAIDKMQP